MTRQAAWEILRSGSDAPTREVDRVCARNGLDDRDRGLVRAIVGTEVRRRGSLRAIVDTFARRRPKPDLIVHLHVGIVQLLFMDKIPDHAALSETCRAVSHASGQSKVAFVHGVLQNILRARREGSSGDPRRDLVGRNVHLDRAVFRDPVKHPLLWGEDALSIPSSLMKRWTRRLRTERAERLARFFLSEPPLVLRAIGDRNALVDELKAADIDARATEQPWSIVCSSAMTGAVTSTPAFREGRLTVQGETAVRGALLLQPEAGERLLDLCAAPGGKAALLAGTGADVVAVDIDEERLDRARQTCERLRVEERVEFIVSDGTRVFEGDESALFDGVLIDAPCSNTGVLGARPEARWRFGPRSMSSLASLQERLFRAGASRVRPGGRLVWSTCSIEPEENARRVATFLAENDGWKLEQDHNLVPDAERGPWDGGYAARLRRTR